MGTSIKVRDLIRMLKADGWVLDEIRGSHHHFRHPDKRGKVTVPVHGKNKDISGFLLNSILRLAGLKKGK